MSQNDVNSVPEEDTMKETETAIDEIGTGIGCETETEKGKEKETGIETANANANVTGNEKETETESAIEDLVLADFLSATTEGMSPRTIALQCPTFSTGPSPQCAVHVSHKSSLCSIQALSCVNQPIFGVTRLDEWPPGPHADEGVREAAVPADLLHEATVVRLMPEHPDHALLHQSVVVAPIRVHLNQIPDLSKPNLQRIH